MLIGACPYAVRNVQIKNALWEGQPGGAKQQTLSKESELLMSLTHKSKAERSYEVRHSSQPGYKCAQDYLASNENASFIEKADIKSSFHY